ncbi:2-phospho-L-lactate guanylyltransferase [Desertihabitans brevis]|uniref:Phosphoenolpyruvate guanylyltransferase n=1 Tax=Desertihabitans brevis TaxID=2268447 RepID=A0A367YZW0_9ACTN|nr:2-phospho-L-lactate guanylyltransferase [Desertihabitans brevis]
MPVAVLAIKPWARAKSRLEAVAPPERAALVRAMALDTCAALAAAGCRLVLVSDEPGLPAALAEAGLAATVLPDPGGGLNPALRAGAAAAVRDGAQTVLAAVSDLPALDADAVTAVLDRLGPVGRWFVPDRSGVGTSMLLARGTALEPAFEGASAARHAASGALALEAPERARLDVDDETDLARALRHGVGGWTAAWAAARVGAG